MYTEKGFQKVSNSNLHEVPTLKPVSNAAAYGISLTARSAVARVNGKLKEGMKLKSRDI